MQANAGLCVLDRTRGGASYAKTRLNKFSTDPPKKINPCFLVFTIPFPSELLFTGRTAVRPFYFCGTDGSRLRFLLILDSQRCDGNRSPVSICPFQCRPRTSDWKMPPRSLRS